jgi:hypothetical protein
MTDEEAIGRVAARMESVAEGQPPEPLMDEAVRIVLALARAHAANQEATVNPDCVKP